MPDCPIYVPGHENAQGMIAVIEAKAITEDFRPDDQMQILNYLQAMLILQPWRQFCFGALWNGKAVTLYMATRTSRDPFDCEFVRYNEFQSFTAQDGQKVFSFLLSASLAELGMVPVVLQLNDGLGEFDLSAATELGRGQFSVGYAFDDTANRCSDFETRCVLKYFPNPLNEQSVRAAWSREVRALTHLKNCKYVSRLISQVVDSVVILQPRGIHFSKENLPTAKDITELTEAVRGVNAAGYFHGDITVGNIFRRMDGSEAFLNDFSHSEPLDCEAPDAAAQAFWKRKDLRALVKALTYFAPTNLAVTMRIEAAKSAAGELCYDTVAMRVKEVFAEVLNLKAGHSAVGPCVSALRTS